VEQQHQQHGRQPGSGNDCRAEFSSIVYIQLADVPTAFGSAAV
jgi:hypothetical protein